MGVVKVVEKRTVYTLRCAVDHCSSTYETDQSSLVQARCSAREAGWQCGTHITCPTCLWQQRDTKRARMKRVLELCYHGVTYEAIGRDVLTLARDRPLSREQVRHIYNKGMRLLSHRSRQSIRERYEATGLVDSRCL